MIKVTIEVYPHGVEKFKRHVGTMIIRNDGTGTKEIGNYKVTLSKFKDSSKIWRRGEVKEFPRQKRGPYDLVYRALHNILVTRNKEKDDGSR